MDVRASFKRTDVGTIPQDWDIFGVRDFKPFITSGSRGWAKYYSDRGNPFIRITNLSRESIYPDLRDLKLVDLPQQETEGYRTALRNGDILISITADIGIIGYVTEEIPKPAYINQHIALLRLPANKIDPKFVSYFLASHGPQSELASITDVGAKLGINLTTVGRLNVVYPPLVEQNRVAAALSDADALIESLKRLIAKKRFIKQGAMQELLSSKRRLSGFTDKWKVVRLGDLGRFLKGSGIKKDVALSGDLPCIRYGEIYTRHANFIRTFYSWISREVAAKAVRLKYGDILFASSGETKEEIGKCVAFVDRIEAYAGGDIVILRSDQSDPIFLGYYLNTAPINQQKASRGQGDAIVHISAASLAAIQFELPSRAEQATIAAMLRDVDAEIALMESRLTKACQLKQGMMQQLLAGKIRLV